MDIELSAGVPVNLTDRLGEGRFRIQNRGPVAVYRTSSANMPDIDQVTGFRHPQGSVWEVALLADPTTWPMWIWADDMATVVAEPAPA